jgi:hypothetical protein
MVLGGYKEIDTAMINSWDTTHTHTHTHTHTQALLEFNTIKHTADYIYHRLALAYKIFHFVHTI